MANKKCLIINILTYISIADVITVINNINPTFLRYVIPQTSDFRQHISETKKVALPLITSKFITCWIIQGQ